MDSITSIHQNKSKERKLEVIKTLKKGDTIIASESSRYGASYTYI